MSEPAPPIRVLIANMPGVLEQLVVELLRQQPDIQLIGQAQSHIDLLAALAEGADVLILGASRADPPPGICSHLLLEFPSLRILVLEHSGDRAMMYWMGLRRRRLSSISGGAVISQIRLAHRLNPAI